MNYDIEYIADNALPKLGWVAIVDPEKETTRFIHGGSVECHGDWAAEGVWDGDFQEGNFHRTEVFFGSGIRKDKNKIYFVTSCALTDRILYCQDRDRLIFSNSLLFLLGFTGATLDAAHDYQSEALSVNLHGINGYDRTFRVVHPKIKSFYQVFYENIVLQKGRVHFEFKPAKKLKLDSYASYYNLLLETLMRIKSNYESQSRQASIKPFSTISSGYDAAAVSALVKQIGVRECFSGNRLDGLLLKSRDENGRNLAERMGYKVTELDTRRSRISEDELYFLATNYPKYSNSVWSEISLHSMVKTIEGLNQTALVFTGYHGDALWNVNLKEMYQEGDFKGHGAISGLNLTEIRLKAGFTTVPLPYLFSRKVKDILAISRSEEMADWRLGNDYDRPIARRIVEEAKIPRHLFGMKKRHITTTYLWPINKTNRLAFFQYLKRHLNISRWYVMAYYLQKRILVMMFGTALLFGRNIDFYDMMRKWATGVLGGRYSALLVKYKKPA